jgi:sugar transferase (PEP-CTERM system associated)
VHKEMSSVLLPANRRALAMAAIQSVFIAAIVAIAAAASHSGDSVWSGTRAIVYIGAASAAAAALTVRGAVSCVMQHLRRRERVLVIGTTDASVTLARELLRRHSQLGLEVVGFVESEGPHASLSSTSLEVLGSIEDVSQIVSRHAVDRVVVNFADASGRLSMERLLELRLRGIAVDHIVSVYERYTGKIAIENLRPSWFIFSSGFRHTPMIAAVKRVFDVVAAIGGLAITAPLMVLIAAAVKLTSAGPVLYSQRRVGHHGRIFTIRKFRSMRLDAETRTGPVWATANDPRLTPIGGFLRSTRLDELPQLWNVLMNDMSLVGPRPERPEFVRSLEQQLKFYGHRHVVKPGLTGWAQISYPYGSSVHDALQKLQYDLYYLKHMSIALDLFIIFATMKTVWSRTGC